MTEIATISPHAAMIYLMVAVSAVDRDMGDAELRRIGDIAQAHPAFAGFEIQRLIPVAQDCAAILQDDEGLSALLGLAAEALPQALRPTAFALALEIAEADGRELPEENRILTLIADALGVAWPK